MKTWGKKSRTCSCTWVPCVQETCTWWQYTYHYPCQDMQDIFPSSITCVFMKLFFWKNLFQKYIRVDKREKCTTHTKIIYIYKVWSKESPETKQICIIFKPWFLPRMDRWILESGTRDSGGPGVRDPGPRCRNLNPRGFLITKNKHIQLNSRYENVFRIWQISNRGLIFYWTQSLLVVNNLITLLNTIYTNQEEHNFRTLRKSRRIWKGRK